MKRILMVCEAFTGGVFAYLSQLCNDMCDDFVVFLAYSVRSITPANYRDALDPRIQLYEIANFGSLSNPVNFVRVLRRLKEIEREVRPDIIHLHSSIAGGFGRIAFNGKHNTVVYTPHGYAHILLGSGLKSRIYEVIEKRLGKRNCITLTCCESEDEVARTLCKRTAYIETGVNLEALSEALDSIHPVHNDTFTVITLGRACVQKQPWLFNRIAQLVPEARFIWIGGGELEGQLTSPNIEVTGWVSRNNALSLAKGADAFILCSLGEAIAMSLIENMYIKNLILASNVMGNKSVIRDGVNGYLCERPEQYAEKIRAAMRRFPLELTEQAYQDVLTKYNTEIMKRRFIAFYNSL